MKQTTAQDYTFDDFVGTWHGYISSESFGGYYYNMTMTIEEDGYYTENTGQLMPSIYPNTQQCEYEASTNRMHWWYLDIVYAGQYFYQHFFYEVVYFQNDTLEMHYNYWDDAVPHPQVGTIFLVKENMTPPPMEFMAEFDGSDINLEWETPSNIPNGVELEGYHIYYAYNDDDFELLTFIEENQYLHMPEFTEGSYFYYLTAVYDIGESDPSAILEVNTTTTGIQPIDLISIVVFPNPATEYIQVSSEDEMDYLEIYSTNGQLIRRINTRSSQTQINCESWDKGIYLLKIGTEKGVFTDKVSIR